MTPHILLLDNYDSFTYNLFQYLAELGAHVTVRRNDAIAIDEAAALTPDLLVISPGPGAPCDAGVSIELIRALGRSVPTLGVCLGHQAIVEAFGGEVVRAPELMHGKTSRIHHTGDGVLTGLPSPFTGVRYHSLCAREATLPACLAVTARSESGVIMGVRHRDLPIEGVQFHPESILTEGGKRLLGNFLAMATSPPRRGQDARAAEAGLPAIAGIRHLSPSGAVRRDTSAPDRAGVNAARGGS